MRRIEKKLNMIKANLLAESRYLETKGLLTEDISGPQKTDSDIEELADDIFKRTKHLIPDRNAVYDAQKKLINDTAKGNKETRDRLVNMVGALTSRVMSKLKGLSEEEISNRVSRLKINEGEYKQKLNEFEGLSHSDDLYDDIVNIIEKSEDDYLKLANYIGGVEDEITLKVKNLIKSQEKYEGIMPHDEEFKSLVKIVTKSVLDALPSEVIQNAKDEGEEVSSDDYFSKYNTTMQEQKEICWNMIKHFKSIDKAIAENEKMMNDKIDRAKAAEAAGDIEEASDYMESIKLFEFRIQYMNNNRDMLSASENPFFNK